MIPKFRCFDKETKNIQDVLVIDFSTGTVEITQYNVVWFMQENKRSMSEVILMQSTGLHDKNGVEIFEGDIVEHLDFNSNEITKSEVRILKGCFYLVISVDGFKYDVPMMDLKDDECILEIKGNIYENPDKA